MSSFDMGGAFAGPPNDGGGQPAGGLQQPPAVAPAQNFDMGGAFVSPELGGNPPGAAVPKPPPPPNPVPQPKPQPAGAAGTGSRIWTRTNGKSFPAEFVEYDFTTGNVILRIPATGKNMEILLKYFSVSDQQYVAKKTGIPSLVDPSKLQEAAEKGEVRLWTNAQSGSQLIASFVKIDGENVILRDVKTGQTGPFPLNQFIKQDQQYVRQRIGQ